MENEVLYNVSRGDKIAFLRDVPGANISLFEKDAVLTADPFNMFVLAHENPNSNKRFLLEGLQMAKFDYAIIDKEFEMRQKEILTLQKAINKCNENFARKQLEARLKLVKENSTHLERIDDYTYRIKELMFTNK